MNKNFEYDLKDWKRVKDNLSLVEQRLKNALAEVLGKHYQTDFKFCFSSENGGLQCKVEFPNYHGSFVLSTLADIQKEVGVSEIEVSIQNNSPACMVFVFPEIIPF